MLAILSQYPSLEQTATPVPNYGIIVLPCLTAWTVLESPQRGRQEEDVVRVKVN